MATTFCSSFPSGNMLEVDPECPLHNEFNCRQSLLEEPESGTARPSSHADQECPIEKGSKDSRMWRMWRGSTRDDDPHTDMPPSFHSAERTIDR